MRRLMNVNDVAGRLNVPRWRAYELIRNGVIPSVRLGQRQIRVDPDRLEAFIAQGGIDRDGEATAVASRTAEQGGRAAAGAHT